MFLVEPSKTFEPVSDATGSECARRRGRLARDPRQPHPLPAGQQLTPAASRGPPCGVTFTRAAPWFRPRPTKPTAREFGSIIDRLDPLIDLRDANRRRLPAQPARSSPGGPRGPLCRSAPRTQPSLRSGRRAVLAGCRRVRHAGWCPERTWTMMLNSLTSGRGHRGAWPGASMGSSSIVASACTQASPAPLPLLPGLPVAPTTP